MSSAAAASATPKAPASMTRMEDNTIHETHGKTPPRKRRRIVISCTECHRRKQKCDRKMPCTNCQSRNKEADCRYETGTPLAKADLKGLSQSSDARSPDTIEKIPKAADFGYSHDGSSTLGILRKIEVAGEPLTEMTTSNHDGDNFGVRERYKAIVRQLPARTYVEKLVGIYFHDINWQYFGVDEPVFRELMDQWYNLPFNVLTTSGPQALDPMLRAFPALLFQILASALLYIPEGSEEIFESLKYTNMAFDDLAFDYSESGVSILSLLGKRQMSIITVLAGWVRASVLKYTGMVTESWHQIGTCIRDAQEIGLHRDQMDPQPSPDDSTEDALEKMWMAQSRRRVWMTLIGWDLHTGAVLGRPTSIDYRVLNRSVPIDAIIPKDRRKTPILVRGENDPPTPLTRAIWSWDIMRPLREILDLEKEGPFPKNFSKVEKIHKELLDLQARTPPPFRLENPDTRFDDLPECWWLPYVRPTLPQLISFNIMALHRPYVFTRASSRHEALKASLDMLEAQRLYFAVLKPQQHKTFTLFFGTFDAIIMIASIYILFPREHLELLPTARQHFQWGIERFETMANRNRLAQAALGVLRAIYVRLKKAVGNGFLISSASDAGNSSTTNCGSSSSQNFSDMQTPNSASDRSLSQHPSIGSNSGVSSSTLPPATAERGASVSSGTGTGLTPASGSDNNNLFANPDWSLPTGFDFSSIMPMYPMADVAYNDLTGVLGGDSSAMWPEAFSSTAAAPDSLPNVPAAASSSSATAAAATAADEQAPWQFGGEFGSDTIWNILNQFPSH
ncbi:hypothetical protein F4779DRAFT_577112 [Xylariaceae sp. FL0662B]|nr:hypothetical protein F4779DRAFT_577112 [Xylariaceae sp. FL0662B]